MDGGSAIIPDDRCDIGTVHEVTPPTPDEDCSAVPVHSDFADPAVVAQRTRTEFYRLIGITKSQLGHGVKIAHLEYMRR